MQADILSAAQVLWDFMQCREPEAPAEVILCLGSNDALVPVHGAQLWQKGLAPLLVMSGGIAHLHDLAGTGWDRSEARVFADAAMAHGVPEAAILLEDQAKNTGDNFRLSRPIIEAALGRRLRSAIVVSRPHMMRRGRATADIEWPDVQLNAQAETVALPDYLDRWAPERMLNLIVGDFQRILAYPALGFQTPQPVPEAAMDAFRWLVAKGFDKHLIAD